MHIGKSWTSQVRNCFCLPLDERFCFFEFPVIQNTHSFETMWLLGLITVLPALSFAYPIDSIKTTPHAPAAHPAVATYNYVSSQLATVITEINQFDRQHPKTDALYRHGMETLETLRRANNEVATGADFDFWTTASFVPALASLRLQTSAMNRALQEKKDDIKAAGVDLVFYTLLKQSYDASYQMRAAVHGKMPSWISDLTKPIIDAAIETMAKARDTFKPAGGDVEVVVVTEGGDPGPYNGPSAPLLPNPIPDNAQSTAWRPLPNPMPDNGIVSEPFPQHNIPSTQAARPRPVAPRPVAPRPVAINKPVPLDPQYNNGLGLSARRCKTDDDE
jgi:hypothetical protein